MMCVIMLMLKHLLSQLDLQIPLIIIRLLCRIYTLHSRAELLSKNYNWTLFKLDPFLFRHAAQLLAKAHLTGLLWCSFSHNQTSANDSECGSASGFQWTQDITCYVSLCLTPQAVSCWLHQVQDSHRICTFLPPLTSVNQCSLQKSAVDERESWYQHKEVQNNSLEPSHSIRLDGGMIFSIWHHQKSWIPLYLKKKSK